jgi:hypothetical protein
LRFSFIAAKAIFLDLRLKYQLTDVMEHPYLRTCSWPSLLYETAKVFPNAAMLSSPALIES